MVVKHKLMGMGIDYAKHQQKKAKKEKAKKEKFAKEKQAKKRKRVAGLALVGNPLSYGIPMADAHFRTSRSCRRFPCQQRHQPWHLPRHLP